MNATFFLNTSFPIKMKDPIQTKLVLFSSLITETPKKPPDDDQLEISIKKKRKMCHERAENILKTIPISSCQLFCVSNEHSRFHKLINSKLIC